ncbi:MAG: methyl-accepting chemotaxis protein [Gammaproteobacteria bacterium]|jgi:methyl-accepting chemotaxis protein|nr:methyl-accepting chemotaxis protein [Gammaproteobacteria bacterium]
MNTELLKTALRGSLFRRVIAATAVGVVVLSTAAVLLARHGLQGLEATTTRSLADGQAALQASLTSDVQKVDAAVREMEKASRDALVRGLGEGLAPEVRATQETLGATLGESAEALAELLARVAPEAILARKYTDLVGYVKGANANPHVVYAVFFKEMEPLTQYVDRQKPKVQALLEKSGDGTAIQRVVAAAAQDPGIRNVRKEIRFEGEELGSVWLGVSTAHVDRAVADMKGRFDVLVEKSSAQVKDILRKEADALGGRLQATVGAVKDQNARAGEAVERTIESATASLLTRQWVVLAAVGLVILAGLCAFFVLRLGMPLAEVSTAMEKIAAGEADLAKRLPARGNDEIAKLARSFNHFVTTLEELVLGVRDTAAELATAGSQLAQGCTVTQRKMQQLCGETDQVATAITQMASTAQEVARTVEGAAHAAQESDTLSREGGTVVGEVVTSIGQLSGGMDQVARVVGKLAADSQSIGRILEVVRGIASQTNLLALNAAIEAARAGEYGRGFAVVADEVRTLAARTQESTEEIQRMIGELQAGTSSAVDVMETGRGLVQASVSHAEAAGEALQSITQAAGTISGLNQQIANAAEEQAAVSEEVNRSVERIRQQAEETAAATREDAAATERIATLLGQLEHFVQRFRA